MECKECLKKEKTLGEIQVVVDEYFKRKIIYDRNRQRHLLWIKIMIGFCLGTSIFAICLALLNKSEEALFLSLFFFVYSLLGFFISIQSQKGVTLPAIDKILQKKTNNNQHQEVVK